MTTESYIKEFNQAINFARDMDLQAPKNVTFDMNKRYFTEQGNAKLLKLYDNIFQSKLNTRLDMKLFALGMIANCSPFHYFLKKHIDKQLGCISYLTVGYILFDDENGKTYHKITTNDIKESLANSKLPKDHHVWLTLDSGEILDMTFSISFQSINDEDFNSKLESGELEINFINRHIDDFKHSMTYKPVIIGSDFFSKIGWDLEAVSYGMYNKYMN